MSNSAPKQLNDALFPESREKKSIGESFKQALSSTDRNLTPEENERRIESNLDDIIRRVAEERDSLNNATAKDFTTEDLNSVKEVAQEIIEEEKPKAHLQATVDIPQFKKVKPEIVATVPTTGAKAVFPTEVKPVVSEERPTPVVRSPEPTKLEPTRVEPTRVERAIVPPFTAKNDNKDLDVKRDVELKKVTEPKRPTPQAHQQQQRRAVQSVSVPSSKQEADKSLQATIFFTGVWIVAAVVIAVSQVSKGLGILEWSGLASMFMMPVLFAWVVYSLFQKKKETQIYPQFIKKELMNIMYPTSETEGRVKEELSSLCRQAAELTDATNESLALIAKAREGLRQEIGQFTTMSKEAEGNVIHLGNVMKDRMLKLDSLTKSLEARTTKIGEKATESSAELERAATNLMQRVGRIETDMGSSVEKVLGATNTAQGRIETVRKLLSQAVTSLELTSEEVSVSVKKSAESFNEHGAQLTQAADRVSKEKTEFLNSIEDQIKALEEMSFSITDRLVVSKQAISDEKQNLQNVIQSVADQTEVIKTTVESSVDEVGSTVEHMREAVSEVEGRIGAQLERLTGVLANLERQGDNFTDIGQSTSRRLGDAMTAALSSADAISDAVRKGADTLRQASDQAIGNSAKVSEKVLERIKSLGNANEGISKRLVEFADLFDKNKASLERASSESEQQIVETKELLDAQALLLTTAFTTTREEIEGIRRSFDLPLTGLTESVAKLDRNSKQIDEVMSKRIEELGSMGDKAVEQASEIRQTLRDQIQELSTLSGQLTSNSRAINEQLEKQQTQLSNQVVDAVTDIEKVSLSLNTQVANVSAASHKASERIHALDSKIAARYEEIQGGAAKAFDALDQLGIRLGQESTSMGAVINQINVKIEHILEALGEGVESISDQSLVANNNTDTLIQKLSDLSTQIEAVAEVGRYNVEQVSDVFEQRIAVLKSVSGTVSADIAKASSILKQQSDNITESAENAGAKIRSAGQMLENQSSDIHLVTDQATLKVESIQKVITGKFHEIASSVGQAVAQLEDVGTKFQKCADEVDESADRIEARFSGASKEARSEIKNLADVAENTALLAAKAIQRVKGETDDFMEEATKSLRSLNEISNDYKDRTNELNVQMERSIELSQDYSNRIRSQITSVGKAANETADEIVSRLADLSDKSLHVGDVASAVSERIGTSSKSLSDQTTHLVTTAKRITDTLGETSNIFIKQSTMLGKASDVAMEKAKEVVEADFGLKREAFFTSAKFVIESLHSLSVDFTRMLEGGEVPEKSWKAFQKGDIAVFTRRLLQLKDGIPVEKIKTKYTDDNEFRNYVQRYFRLFEEIYDNAAKTDHSDLLTSTFSGSDIGKLYYFLCTVTEREPRGEDKRLLH